ncbi:replicative DNA helicase [Schlesneria sp. T3-172]|uniref:replicative DNA helicase n=1 Tax=Schlesneria sphaerica TaxID=3373610 RepID=UPI0037C6C004
MTTQQAEPASYAGRVKADQAEKWLIATLLLNHSRYIVRVGEFDGTQLVHPAHRAIWKAMEELHSEDIPVDAVTVLERVSQLGMLSELPDGAIYLFGLLEEAQGYVEDHAEEWSRIVVARAAYQKLISDLDELKRLALFETDLDGIRSRIATLSTPFPKERRRRTVLMPDAVAEYCDRLETGTGETFHIGIPAIDRAIGGVAAGEMVVIGGRPSHGKSMVACNWIDAAASHGFPGLIVSEEMSRDMLAQRALQGIMTTPKSEWGTDLNRLRWEVSEHYRHRAPIAVSEFCGTMDAVERAVAESVQKYATKIVAIDYAQLIKVADAKTRYEQITEVSIRSKSLARKHDIIVLLLAQLNRQITSRADATPTMSDLQGSGQLEQDADVILFPYWPVMIQSDYERPDEYRIYQVKNRSRGIATPIIQLRINAARQRLEEWVPDSDFPSDPWETANR